MTVSELLSAALSYARRGWFVFPLPPRSKEPFSKDDLSLDGEGGFKVATTDEGIICDWWARWPRANVGLDCGRSHLVVVDVDPDKGGMDSWRDLRAEVGPEIENTIVNETGGGGLHYLYQANSNAIHNSTSILAPGIDIRGDGGFIVAPPSIHPSGRSYGWALGCGPDDVTLAPFPHSLAVRLYLAEKQKQKAEGTETDIIEGRRNETLARLAGVMRRRGMTNEEIIASLLVVNANRCHPALEEEEVRAIAKSITRYEPQPEILELNETDYGNAEALALLCGERLRYDHRRKRWLMWNGQRWAEDKDQQIFRLAHDVAKARYIAAAHIEDDGQRKAAVKWALRCESKRAIRDMMELATGVKPISCEGDIFDRESWLIGCENGVLDLIDGELREARPGDAITMSAGYSYSPEAKCPRWMQFLDEIFSADRELITFIKVAVGYSITGDTREQCLFLCWGGGCNGKSVFLNTLRSMLGDYATNTAFSTFELEARSAIPNDVAALVGRRFVTASETTEARRLNEARVKAITGGDPITCRFMRGEFFTYQPSYKVWLAMNHKPVVTGTDNGIWRRIRLIPFTTSFAGREDKILQDKLHEELPGILAWAVEGALIWQECGMADSEAVELATQAYREESDVVGQFTRDCIEKVSVGKTKIGDVYREYESWCRELNEKPMTGNALTRRLAEMGFERVRDGGARYFRGLALKGKPVTPDSEELTY